MARRTNIRAERSAMQERVRAQKMGRCVNLPPRILLKEFGAFVCRTPQPTPTRPTKTGGQGMRWPTTTTPDRYVMVDRVRAKIAEVKHKQQLATAVDEFTLQHGCDYPELKGTEFEGAYHLDLVMSFHPMEYVAERLAPPNAAMEATKWLNVMNAAFTCCPLSVATIWDYGNAVGMQTFKGHLHRLLAMLESEPAK